MQDTHTSETGLSRRELLKVLAASGGALAAAAFLPARWSRPLVQAGVLPAHAQATCAYNFTIDRVSPSTSGWDWVAYLSIDPAIVSVPSSYTITYGGVHLGLMQDFSIQLLPPGGPYVSGQLSFNEVPGMVGRTLVVDATVDYGCTIHGSIEVPEP